jgi:hypothetical protein
MKGEGRFVLVLWRMIEGPCSRLNFRGFRADVTTMGLWVGMAQGLERKRDGAGWRRGMRKVVGMWDWEGVVCRLCA